MVATKATRAVSRGRAASQAHALRRLKCCQDQDVDLCAVLGSTAADPAILLLVNLRFAMIVDGRGELAKLSSKGAFDGCYALKSGTKADTVACRACPLLHRRCHQETPFR